MAEVSKSSEAAKTGSDVIIPNLYCNMDTMKTTSCSSSIPTSPVGLTKAASVKRHSCLCSPTTHAGSFRCRHHRNTGGMMMRTSMSVGSKLSGLDHDKSTVMCENVRFIGAHGQGSHFLPA